MSATENATHSIMASAERIEKAGGRAAEDVSGQIVDEVTSIYEACVFQDITGQRIRKVVDALRCIEVKVEALVAVMAGNNFGSADTSDEPEDAGTGTDDELMNGPQLPENAISQDDIDELFASSD